MEHIKLSKKTPEISGIYCEARREKEMKYLSNRSIHGTSFQKCGRVAIATYGAGIPICRKCMEERHLEKINLIVKPKESKK